MLNINLQRTQLSGFDSYRYRVVEMLVETSFVEATSAFAN
jgi:hypothetical protein